MKDVDRPADIQPFPQPAGGGRPCVDVEASRDVLCSEDVHRIGGHPRRRRDIGQGPTIRPSELQCAVRLLLDPIPLLVDGSVVTPTKQREV